MKVSGERIAEGYMLPFWYGVAYYDYCSSYKICYPIPFNLLVRWVRNIFWAIKKPSDKLDAVNKAYQTGRHESRVHCICDRWSEREKAAIVKALDL